MQQERKLNCWQALRVVRKYRVVTPGTNFEFSITLLKMQVQYVCIKLLISPNISCTTVLIKKICVIDALLIRSLQMLFYRSSLFSLLNTSIAGALYQCLFLY